MKWKYWGKSVCCLVKLRFWLSVGQRNILVHFGGYMPVI